MRNQIPFTLLLFLIIQLNSLVNGQEIVTGCGDYFKNNNNSISFTIGEPVIETINNKIYFLTQGFQQSMPLKQIAVEINEVDNKIAVFPNPVSDILNIVIPDIKNVNYLTIHNSSGELILYNSITKSNVKIDFQNYPASIYLLRIYDNTLVEKSFKLIKK